MVLSVSELNELTDDVLSERVAAVLTCLAEERTPDFPAVAPFVTAGVLLRLHNFVQATRRLGCNKQSSLAMVVANFTGVRLKNKDEAEYIGNAQDAFLRNHCLAMKKAKQAMATAACKARKAGKALALSHHKKRIASLEERVYRCEFGGVPRHVIVSAEEDSRCRAGTSIHKRPVPFRKIEFADEVNAHLKRELIDAVERERALQRERERDIARVAALAEREEKARRQAEQLCVVEVDARHEAEEARREAEASAREAVKHLRQQTRKAEREAEVAKGQIARLGGQIAASHREAGAAMLREKAARERAQQEASEQAEARRTAEAKAQEAAAHLRQEKRAAERAAQQSEAKIARLGGQVVAAHKEAAILAERERKALSQAEQDVEAETEARRAAEAKAEQAAAHLRQAKRTAERAALEAEARIARLGGQVASAHFEVGEALVQVERAEHKIQDLKRLVYDGEQTIEHLRSLKAQMARKKREAESKAQTAGALEWQLQQAKKKCRQLRVEASSARAALCVAREASDSALEDDSMDSEDDASETEAAHSSAARRESDVALERVKSMPTWRPIHEGRGGAKLEWGTRMIIYSLLALLVPPSAIGPVIVLIVKRTAPWLNPTAPTCKTVQRCRFELRFVEEALAGRRISSAHRLRGIGFDETTKFGNSALTSNVTIEPTEGAPLEDVITRAAYCPMGGTSELVVESVKMKCFARLRDLQRRWKAHFESMFPYEEWTGPDPAQCSLARLGGGGAIMGDTCNTAQLSKKKMAQAIAETVEESMGPEKWAALSDEERDTATRTHLQDCWQHLRNIFLAEMSKAMSSHVAEDLKPELDTFAQWERMSTEFSQLLRAAYKVS